jgi:hypothetical protein
MDLDHGSGKSHYEMGKPQRSRNTVTTHAGLNLFCSELTRPMHPVHGMISAHESSLRTTTITSQIKPKGA